MLTMNSNVITLCVFRTCGDVTGMMIAVTCLMNQEMNAVSTNTSNYDSSLLMHLSVFCQHRVMVKLFVYTILIFSM